VSTADTYVTGSVNRVQRDKLVRQTAYLLVLSRLVDGLRAVWEAIQRGETLRASH
jgi:hypothetical protein